MLIKEWFDSVGSKMFGGDGVQTVDEALGHDEDEDESAVCVSDDGDEFESVGHATGAAAKFVDGVQPADGEVLEGVPPIADPAMDPLYFMKLAEARGKVFM